MGVSIDTPKVRIRYGEIFNRYFPIYLSYGMTYSQFWDEEPELAIAYRKSYEISLKQRNTEMWLNGVYTKKALESTIVNMFKKKGEEPFEYPKEPLPITEKEAKEMEERMAKERFERMKQQMILASQVVNRKEK